MMKPEPFSYPPDYRQQEVDLILHWISAGDCAAILGLSGSGKSNLLRSILEKKDSFQNAPELILIDCNRLSDSDRTGFYNFAASRVDPATASEMESLSQSIHQLEMVIDKKISRGARLSLLFDRFDFLYGWIDFPELSNNLRALRDAFKFRLTYVVAVRKMWGDRNELAELFFGHTVWLGALSPADASWSVTRDLQRLVGARGMPIRDEIVERIVSIGGGYPSLLRAICEAYADGASLDLEELRRHPAILRRVDEFWSDSPDERVIRETGLQDHPLLSTVRASADAPIEIDESQLTLKEQRLWEALSLHAGEVCEKDQLIQYIWPEDVIFEQGIRDESLAQLVRRLRLKIERDPANPQLIQTVPGRGYILRERLK